MFTFSQGSIVHVLGRGSLMYQQGRSDTCPDQQPSWRDPKGGLAGVWSGVAGPVRWNILLWHTVSDRIRIARKNISQPKGYDTTNFREIYYEFDLWFFTYNGRKSYIQIYMWSRIQLANAINSYKNQYCVQLLFTNRCHLRTVYVTKCEMTLARCGGDTCRRDNLLMRCQ